MRFKNHARQQRCPIAVYVDFEALTVPVSSCEPSPSDSFLQAYQLHEPFSVGVQVVCDFDEARSQRIELRGRDVANQLIDHLADLAKEYDDLLKHPTPLLMREEDEVAFQNSDACHICKGPFLPNSARVRDHDHFTGLFRGAAHQDCNVNFRAPKHIPVLMHNGSGYDWHFLLQAWAESSYQKLSVIPHNHERFVSVSQRIGGVELRFLDSFKFLGASLDGLSHSLSDRDLKFTRTAFPDDALFALARRKGVFPYDYVDCMVKLEETSLPPREAFFNRLKNEHILGRGVRPRADRVGGLLLSKFR